MSLINANLVGLSIAGAPDPTLPYVANGTRMPFAWSNCDFSQASPAGTDVVTLLLQLILSQAGDGTNGVYDVFESGIGIGYPQGLVNVASFTNILSSCDWDTAAQLFFAFPEPVAAKDFLEKEICAPLGLYLSVNNAGLLTLNRPKHPQKFYVGGANQVFAFNLPSGTGPYLACVPIGVYTGPGLATALQSALNGAGLLATFYGAIGTGLQGLSGQGYPTGGPWTVTYSTATHKFTVQNSSQSFDLLALAGGNPPGCCSWNTVGFTVNHSGVSAGAPGISSDVAVGQFGGAVPLNGGGTYTPGAVTLNQGDVWDLQEIANQDSQVTRVIYEFDYDWDRDVFASQKMYIDADAVNLGDALGSHDLVISAKGLVSGGLPQSGSSPFWTWWQTPGYGGTPSGACGVQPIPPAAPAISSFAVDADTWAQLYALMVLDRYKYPPLRFRCKTKLGGGLDSSSRSAGTRIEVGDAVQFTYNVASVLTDRELDLNTFSNRVFEVVGKTDNWKSGYVELELQGYSGNITY